MQPKPLLTITARHIAGASMFLVALCLSLFVVRTYQQVDQERYGWTKLIMFGSEFAQDSLPRLQRLVHYVDPDPGSRFGYDGQFYAQIAIDPTLRDPAFDNALDNPAYRGRRIGLPFLSYCLGWGKPRWIIQAYSLANLLFWFLLLAALAALFSPWSVQQQLCFAAAMLGCGVLASMEQSLTDLPAAALIFWGAIIGSWGGCAAWAAAVLTRETSLLAVFGFLEVRWPMERATWKRNLALLALVVAPFALWFLYVSHRFDGLQRAAGGDNFALPLQSMFLRFADAVGRCTVNGFTEPTRQVGPLGWLYADFDIHEILTIAAILFQGLYFALRRNYQAVFWRTGVCYLALCCFLGPAVWENTSAAARVMLPMTICFYLLLCRERAGWFWPFFILGGLSIPYGVHEFWFLS